MSKSAIQVFLFLFISVFVFNQVSDLMLQHKKETGSYCCELTEVEELSELTTRLKPLDLSGFQFSFLNLRRWIQRNSDVDKAWTEVLQGSFFPHALHVPIFLDKCVFLI